MNEQQARKASMLLLCCPYANASLVTYSKAAKFKVIREEIPCFNASFSAESAAKQLGLKEEGGTE